MKKKLLYVAAFAMGLAITLPSCGDSNDTPTQQEDPEGLDYTQENAASWNNYMKAVSSLLSSDASRLYADWNTSYNGGESFASLFKKHTVTYTSALSCVEQIIDGCIDIANEVGETKIGDPYSKYIAGKQSEALYAVESWYSWHSREDYSNNIISICNAFCGTREDGIITGTAVNTSLIASQSMYSVLHSVNASLAEETLSAIKKAHDAILNIPQPFRDHIASTQSVAAQDACAELKELLENKVKPAFRNTDAINDDEILDPVVAQYVDNVVLPTYSDLKDNVAELYNKISALAANPTNQAFKDACNAWMEARQPWETSEAFLFGPVADQGLDPNMDSWPLDQAAIVNVMKSGDYSQLEWSGDFDEDNDKISAVQSVRGFHTLEYLLFKDGVARSVQ